MTRYILALSMLAGCGGDAPVPDGPAAGAGLDTSAKADAPLLSPTTTELELIAETNARRSLHDLWCGPTDDRDVAEYPPGPTLLVDERLVASARAHARVMADTDTLEHQTIGAIRAAGGRGENIAMLGAGRSISSGDAAPGIPWDDSFASSIPRPVEIVPEQLVQAWYESPGHCHNMLSHRWTHMGASIALSAETDRWYGIQLFGMGP